MKRMKYVWKGHGADSEMGNVSMLGRLPWIVRSSYKKAMPPQGNRAMPQLLLSV